MCMHQRLGLEELPPLVLEAPMNLLLVRRRDVRQQLVLTGYRMRGALRRARAHRVDPARSPRAAVPNPGVSAKSSCVDDFDTTFDLC